MVDSVVIFSDGFVHAVSHKTMGDARVFCEELFKRGIAIRYDDDDEDSIYRVYPPHSIVRVEFPASAPQSAPWTRRERVADMVLSPN